MLRFGHGGVSESLIFNIVTGFNDLLIILLFRLAIPLCSIHSKPAWWSSCVVISRFLALSSVNNVSYHRYYRTSSTSYITPAIHLVCCLFYSTILILHYAIISFLISRFCMTTTSLTRRRRKEAHLSVKSKGGWQTRNSVLRPRIDIPYLPASSSQ